MLLLNVFKGNPVPLDVFDSAVWVFKENVDGAGLYKNPLWHALGADNEPGVFPDPFKIMRPLMKRLKVRAWLRPAKPRRAGTVS